MTEETKPADAEVVNPVEVVKVEKANARVQLGVGVLFSNVAEVWSIADNIRRGGGGPPKATTASLFLAILKGQSLGINIADAVSSITVVNGRASLMGDVALGLLRKSGLLKTYRREWVGAEGTDGYGCKVTMARKDTGEEIDYTFTFGEAKKAGLCRTAMWTGFTKRMVYYRTLGFVMRDLFSDVLMGLYLTEELQNEREIEAGAFAVAAPQAAPASADPDPLFATPPAPTVASALQAEGRPALPAPNPPEIESDLILDPALVAVVPSSEAQPVEVTPEVAEVDDEAEAAAQRLLAAFEKGTLKRDDEVIVTPTVEVAPTPGNGLGPSGIPNAPDDPFRGFRDEPPAKTKARAVRRPASDAKPKGGGRLF
jgi:hypothetical protein